MSPTIHRKIVVIVYFVSLASVERAREDSALHRREEALESAQETHVVANLGSPRLRAPHSRSIVASARHRPPGR